MNMAIFSGTVEKNPELRKSRSGVMYTNIFIRVAKSNEIGEIKYEYVKFISFGENAKEIADKLKKDNKVIIQGEYTYNSHYGPSFITERVEIIKGNRKEAITLQTETKKNHK